MIEVAGFRQWPIAASTPPKTARNTGSAHGISRALWMPLTAASVVVGLLSLRYLLPGIPFPAPLPNFTMHRSLLVAHAGTASVALLLGPGQFLYTLNRSGPSLHRLAGRAYFAALLIAAVTAVPVALHAAGGLVSTLGFLALAAAWLTTAGIGLLRILQNRVEAHRFWMTRCFALTAAAITLRLLIPASQLFHIPFAVAYPAIAWLCWVPNLCLAELWLRGGGGQRKPHFSDQGADR